MNPSGLWIGRTRDGRVGHLKFVNVEVIGSSKDSGNRNDEVGQEDEQEEDEPTTVEKLLTKHCLQVRNRYKVESHIVT